MSDGAAFEVSTFSDSDLAIVFAGMAETLRSFELNLVQLQDVLSMEFAVQSAVRMPMEMQSLDRATQGIAAVAQMADRMRHAILSDMHVTIRDLADPIRPVEVRDRIIKSSINPDSDEVHFF
jgi:endonuclease/exonuclease/phosphatase family metal-dependent hydrolase